MAFVSILALIMLTLVGYAAGTALAARGKEPQPPVYDLLLVLLLWFGALATRELLGRWGAIGVWLVVGFVIGAVLGALRFRALPVIKPAPAPPAGANIFKRLWYRWSIFAQEMGNYQGRILMGFFYFIVVTPFGLGMRLFSDPLAIKQTPPTTGWVAKADEADSLDAAREQG